MLWVNLCSSLWIVNVQPEEVHTLVAAAGHRLAKSLSSLIVVYWSASCEHFNIYDELLSIPLLVSVVAYCLLNPYKTIIANKIKL